MPSGPGVFFKKKLRALQKKYTAPMAKKKYIAILAHYFFQPRKKGWKIEKVYKLVNCGYPRLTINHQEKAINRLNG